MTTPKTYTRNLRPDELPERFELAYPNGERYVINRKPTTEDVDLWVKKGIRYRTDLLCLNTLPFTKTLPVPPPGTDVSVEDARELHKAGVKLEYFSERSWLKAIYVVDGYKFRIAAEPRRVPLGPEDVRGAWIRFKVNPSVEYSIHMITNNGVKAPGCDTLTWEWLMDNCEIIRPGGDWLPCWKEVV